MTKQVRTKWKLKKLCLSTCFFIVVDRVSGKEYQYQVPNMQAVELSGNSVYVHTSTNKLLLIDLITTNRRFVDEKLFQPSFKAAELGSYLSLDRVS